MKRLSLEELKANKNVVANLESIKGGNTDNCHVGQTPAGGTSTPIGAGTPILA